MLPSHVIYNDILSPPTKYAALDVHQATTIASGDASTT
jgi:hypothetical protein